MLWQRFSSQRRRRLPVSAAVSEGRVVAQQRGWRVGSCAGSVHEAPPAAHCARVGFPGSDVHLDHAVVAHAGLEHGQGLGVAHLANLRKRMAWDGPQDMGMDGPPWHTEHGAQDLQTAAMHGCAAGSPPAGIAAAAAAGKQPLVLQRSPASRPPLAHQGQVGHLHEGLRGRREGEQGRGGSASQPCQVCGFQTPCGSEAMQPRCHHGICWTASCRRPPGLPDMAAWAAATAPLHPTHARQLTLGHHSPTGWPVVRSNLVRWAGQVTQLHGSTRDRQGR